MKQIVLWVLSALLAAVSVWYAAATNYNFGNLLVWLLTAVCVLYTLFWRQVDAFLLHTIAGRVALGLLAAGCTFFVFVLGVILRGQWAAAPARDARAVVVLGCAVHGETPSRVLEYRLETAYQYHVQNPDAVLVVCGGQGPGEDIAEAEAMRRWLVQRGVPAGQILCEDQSTSTEENFAFAKELLARRGIDAGEPAVYVTNGFHCYRAGKYAAAAGFARAQPLAAGLPLTQILPCYLREVFAVVYYWAFKSPHTGFMKNLVGLMALVQAHPGTFK